MLQGLDVVVEGVAGDVLGELGMRVFFKLWQKDEAKDASGAASAAEGWGGDRYYYFENKKTGKDLLVWKIVWDTADDAAEFATAYRLLLAERFPNMKKAWTSGEDSRFAYQVWEVEPGRFLKLMRKETESGIIDTTDRGMIDIMWK